MSRRTHGLAALALLLASLPALVDAQNTELDAVAFEVRALRGKR